MKTGAVMAGVGIGAGVLWWAARRAQEQSTDSGGGPASVESLVDGAAETIGTSYDNLLGGALGEFGVVRVAAMYTVDRSALENANVRAMLAAIRMGEVGTTGPEGYTKIYGGRTFTDFSDHPRVTVTDASGKHTPAGAYQITAGTWDETRAAMGLTDFSPASQDVAALGRIAARGALSDVLAGRIDKAAAKLKNEWSSLPAMGTPRVRSLFLAYGGTESGAVYA